MAFIDDVKTLASKLALYKNYIDNEENTKNALVLPMIRLLGYDIHDPSVVRAEYPCPFGTSKDARVDYAIVNGSTPLILIEVKPLGTDLDKHHGQIMQYYYARHPIFCVLTDGNEYRLYSDVVKKGFFDDLPCIQFRLSDPNVNPAGFNDILYNGFTPKQSRKTASAYYIINTSSAPTPVGCTVAPHDGYTPSQEELDLYEAVKAVLANIGADNDITYAKKKVYFAVTPKGKKQSICRFQVLQTRTWLYFYMYIDGKEEKYPIASIADVAKYADKIIKLYNDVK